MNKKIKAYDRLLIARMVERPTTLDYIDKIFTNFFELHGDRCYKDDKSIVGGIGLLNGNPITIIGIQKGKDLKENMERNFGSPHPEGYRKALRLMKQAEKFNRPIVCFINTSGAYCGVGAEERGQGEAIARNLIEIAQIKVPIISIIIGEGGSGGALALACGDRVWMLENSVYSILSPEGFASILWKDATRAKEASEVMKITAKDLKCFNIIDSIIEEPVGGAHEDPKFMCDKIKENILNDLEKLINTDLNEVVDMRYNKFRKIGNFY